MSYHTIHEMSPPATKSELDLYCVPYTQGVIQDNSELEVLPSSNVTIDAKRIEFNISAQNEFLDLSNVWLDLTIQVKKIVNGLITNLVDAFAGTAANGSIAAVPAHPKDEVIPNQYFLNTMWNNMELHINGKRVTSQNNMYHTKSYTEGLMFIPQQMKDTILKAAMWDSDANRKNRVSMSKSVNLYGRTHLDMFQQHRLLLPGTPIRIVFYLNSDAINFKVVTANLKPKLTIQDIRLRIRKFTVDPSACLGIEKGLQATDAKYFMSRAEPCHLTIPSGVQKYSIDNAVKSTLPRLFILSFTPNENYAGSLTTDTLRFDHNNVNYLAAYRSGKLICGGPLKPDYTANYARDFVELYRNLCQDFKPIMKITMDEYKDGKCFYAFNLTPDYSNVGVENGMTNVLQQDSIRIDIGFSETTPHTISAVLHPIYDSHLTLDLNREVKMDY